jgi:hypothetical protein
MEYSFKDGKKSLGSERAGRIQIRMHRLCVDLEQCELFVLTPKEKDW